MLSTVVLLSLCLMYRRRRSRGPHRSPSRGGSVATQVQRYADNSDVATTPYVAAEESRSMYGSSEKFLDLLIKDNFTGEMHHRCLLDTEHYN